MHWIETLVEVFAEFFLNLAGLCLGEERGKPRTVVGWIALLLAILAMIGMIAVIVRSFLFSK